MLKLMKYEFRKTAFLKFVLLLLTAVAEVVYLVGVFAKKDGLLALGIFFLVLCTIIGIFWVGIWSVIVLHRDLNTKQSYMLFLTPKSSYEILGAKILENGISIVIAGAFFAALAVLDMTVATIYIGGWKELYDLVNSFLEVTWSLTFTPANIAFSFFGLLASWIVYIVNADLAVILSSTILTGKKGNAVVSFIIFMILSVLLGMVMDRIPSLKSVELTFVLYIAVTLVIAAALYLISGWIMEKKLSV